MATNKNITMKQFNEVDYDTLYPKTIAAQIDDVYSKDEMSNLFLPKAGGTMGGILDMNGNRIANLASPVVDGDAVNKGYVDGNFLNPLFGYTKIATLTNHEIVNTLTSFNTSKIFELLFVVNGEIQYTNKNSRGIIFYDNDGEIGKILFIGYYSTPPGIMTFENQYVRLIPIEIDGENICFSTSYSDGASGKTEASLKLNKICNKILYAFNNTSGFTIDIYCKLLL